MRVEKKIPLVFGVPGASFFDGVSSGEVFVAELRPALEGAKRAARACLRRGIRPVVICDNMLAHCMKSGLVSEACIFCHQLGKEVVRAHCGALAAAICARFHKIPVRFFPAAARPQRAPLDKIGGVGVTLKTIKTYVPLEDIVPLSFADEVVT